MAKRMGIAAELFQFVRKHKAYWLVPIIVVIVLLVALVFLGGTGAAPFIYTLF